jgi:glycosyltransferase involved in cell wall biosynthesis
MTIGIDLTIFRSYQGTEVFTENIVLALVRQNPDVKFVIFKGQDFLKMFDTEFSKMPNVRIINFKRFRNSIGVILQQQLLLPFLCPKYGVDILYSPSPFFSYFAPAKKISTIHDCAYARYKEFRNVFSEVYILLSIDLAKHLCSAVLTVSNFSKGELIQMYHFNPDKIKMVYEGPANPDLSAQESTHNPILKDIFGDIFAKKYFIYVGITRPRKNIIRLVEAFKIFLSDHPEYKLVLAGSISTAFVDVGQKIKELNLEESVIQSGFVSNTEKTLLFKNAQALTYPSLYEGFGLPVLEAQALGLPVLTSNTSSLPEVAGTGAICVDPLNIQKIAEAMNKIVENNNFREQLILDGYKNVKRFSWEEAAKEVMRIFKKI